MASVATGEASDMRRVRKASIVHAIFTGGRRFRLDLCVGAPVSERSLPPAWASGIPTLAGFCRNYLLGNLEPDRTPATNTTVGSLDLGGASAPLEAV